MCQHLENMHHSGNQTIQMVNVQSYAWIKDPSKINQYILIEQSLKRLMTVSYSMLQLTFKQLSLVKVFCNIKE